MVESSEKMSYVQACNYLEIKMPTLYGAISRGALTPLPRVGIKGYLSTKQVMLFKGKPLALSVLTKEEGEIWKEAARMTGIDVDRPSVLPYLDKAEKAGKEKGERFGRNYARSVYQSIREYDPTTEESLRRPLAI